MRAKLYGIFVGTKWAMSRNKKEAMRLAKEGHGTVRAMPLPYGHSLDGATFRVLSDEIADFRQAQVAPNKSKRMKPAFRIRH